MSSIDVGVYRHYKGNEYYVLGLAQHGDEAIDERFVVYIALYPKTGPRLFVRPHAEFFSTVKSSDGALSPRFVKIGDPP